MPLPSETTPEASTRSFWSIEKILILSVYAGLMIWHACVSDSVGPIRTIGMTLLALSFVFCWFAEIRIVPLISEKIVLPFWCWWIPWTIFALTVGVTALIDAAEQLYDPTWLSKPVLTGLKMFAWYASSVLIRVFKFPPEAEPEHGPASPKPARPSGMQDPVITHRWWEKYH